MTGPLRSGKMPSAFYFWAALEDFYSANGFVVITT